MSERLLKIAEVKSRISMGDTWIYEQIKDGRFPKPIKLSPRCARWRESDINQWIEKQSALAQPG